MTNAPASYEEIRTAIMGLLQAQFRRPPTPAQAAANSPGDPWLPMEWENRQADPITPSTILWGRASIQWGDSGAASLGTGHRRTIGVLFVQIFQREKTGTKETNEAVDKLAAILDHLQLITPHCRITGRTVARDTVGMQKEGWYQSNAYLTFWADSMA